MKISKRYTKTWSTLWGVVMIACGCAVAWSGNVGVRDASPLLDRLAALVETPDPLLPTPENNNKTVRVAATLSSAETLEDEFLLPNSWLILDRKVEMFQWSEESVSRAKSADDSKVDPPAPSVTYELGWHDRPIDFFGFKEPRGHENPAFTVSSGMKRVQSAAFGGYDGLNLIDYLARAGKAKFFSELAVTAEMLKDSSHEIRDNWIYVRRSPMLFGDNVGDLRIRYKIFPRQLLTIIARQENTNQLKPGKVDGEEYFLVESGDVSLSDMLRIDAQKSGRSRVTFFGWGLIFFGFLSVLIPISAKLDLRPNANLTGVSAAVALSAVGSTVIILLMLIGAWIKG